MSQRSFCCRAFDLSAVDGVDLTLMHSRSLNSGSESSFPPLTWPPTSSARIPRIRMTAKAATNTATRALVNANDGQDNSNQKKAKKNKKKKKKKKPKTEEAAELDV